MNNVEFRKGDIIEFHGKEYEVYAVNPTHRTYGEGAGFEFPWSDGITFIDEDDYEYWVPQKLATFVRRPNETATVLADESLGGIMREYREVRRRARAGDLIKVIAIHPDSSKNGHIHVGEVLTALKIDRVGDVRDVKERDMRGIISENWDGLREYVVLEPTDIVRIDGARYRMVKRNAEKGERIIIVNASAAQAGKVYGNGYVMDVESLGNVGWPICGEYSSIAHSEYRVLEPVDTKPVTEAPETSSFPSDQLSHIIASLERRVDALEREAGVGKYAKPLGAGARFEVEELSAEKRSRDEIVAQAKADVARLEKRRHVKYAIHRRTRTVIAVICDSSLWYEVSVRGIAKCAPGDVFNVHIGKAIALRRALGLSVPEEYTRAPAPEKPQVGDIVKFPVNDYRYEIVGEPDTSGELTDNLRGFDTDGSRFRAYGGDFRYATIIDDSRTGTEAEDYGL